MSIDPRDFLKKLQDLDISFFAGLPDSLLKDICACISSEFDSSNHTICANEGAAVALGIGYHLATEKIPLIYFQNSGIGNAMNPLVSLACKKIYSIPMLLMIGWRGEPNTDDEPQHVKQGEILLPMLKSMDIPYVILDKNFDEAQKILEKTVSQIKKFNHPHAIIIQKNTFAPSQLISQKDNFFELSREDAIKHIISSLNDRDILVSTTGKASREVFECRSQRGESHESDFLVVGGMGHASHIALGIAIKLKNRQVFCIDGDGAAIMHMGSLAINGTSKCDNFKHILLNNGAHDSVGGQPTVGFDINFPQLAIALGYRHVNCAQNFEQLQQLLDIFKQSKGPSFLEVRVNKGDRQNLIRPNLSLLENKRQFINYLKDVY